jgi:hypothetical protein
VKIFLAFFVLLSLSVSATAQSIANPNITVGDWWEFKSPKGTITPLVVSRVSPDGFSILNKNTHQESTYTPSFNKLSGYYLKNGEPVSYTPHNYNFEFPLHPGKTWKQRVTSKTSEKELTYTVQANVIAWEEIEISDNGQSKRLQALKIDYQHGDVASTCWYSPEANNVVRCVSPFPGQTFETIGFGKS